MTSRERVINAVELREGDRIPRYDGFWEDTIPAFEKSGMKLPRERYIELEGGRKPVGNPLNDFFGFDVELLFMDYSMRFPSRLVSDEKGMITVEDQCGYTARKFKGKASSIRFLSCKCPDEESWEEYRERLSFHPEDTARMDSEGYFLRTKPYPSWKEAKLIYDELRKTGRYICAWGYGPFENTWRFHGYENSLMDLLAEPEMMEDMLTRSTDVLIRTITFMVENDMKPDAVWIAEDMGSTATTLFSRSVYRELLWPCHRRIGDFCKRNGLHFWMHSCGKIESFLPDLIEAGLNVIQALQANTGMNVVDLKERFGSQLCFMGNIGEQEFVKGKEGIEKELRSKVPAAMKGGGYIYHSDHSIPPEVSYETYLHAMKVLDEIGVYRRHA